MGTSKGAAGEGVGFWQLAADVVKLAVAPLPLLWNWFLLVVAHWPIIIIVAVLTGLYTQVFLAHDDAILEGVEELRRSVVNGDEFYPLVSMLRAACEEYAGIFLKFWNYVSRVSRILSSRAIKKVILGCISLPATVYDIFSGLYNILRMTFYWLTNREPNIANGIYPFGYVLTQLQATVGNFVELVECSCGELRFLAYFIQDFLYDTEFVCAIHHVVTGLANIAQQWIRVCAQTLWDLIFHGDFNTETPDIAPNIDRVVAGANRLVRVVRRGLVQLICNNIGLFRYHLENIDQCETICEEDCDAACMSHPLNFRACHEACMSNCTEDCYASEYAAEYATCLADGYEIVDKFAFLDAAASVVLRGAALVLPLENLAHMYGDQRVAYLYSATDKFFDTIRDPEEWFDEDGAYTATPYAGAFPTSLPQSCPGCAGAPCNQTYVDSIYTCSDCEASFLAGADAPALDRALCTFGVWLDDVIEIPDDWAPFEYIFCRLLGSALRLAVSGVRYVLQPVIMAAEELVGMTFHDESLDIQRIVLYFTYEPNADMVYEDLKYAANSLAFVFPNVIGSHFMFMQIATSNLIEIGIEIGYDSYMLLARFMNTIIRAIDGVDRRADGYLYLNDFFCLGENCVHLDTIADLIRVPRAPQAELDVCSESTIVNLWNPETNPDGDRALLEALETLINIEILFELYGIDVDLPNFYQPYYYVFRGVTELGLLALKFLVVTVEQIVFPGNDGVGFYNYLTCVDGTVDDLDQCAQFSAVICDAEWAMMSPCDILGDEDEGLGIPCICPLVGALAKVIANVARSVVQLIRVTDPDVDLQLLLDSLRDLVGTHAGDPSRPDVSDTALYELANAIACPALFLGDQCIGDPFREPIIFDTAWFTPREAATWVLIDVASILSYVPEEVIDIVEAFADYDGAGDISNLISGILRDLLRLVLGWPQTQAHAAPLPWRGERTRAGGGTRALPQHIGSALTCLMGPYGCHSQQDRCTRTLDNPFSSTGGACFGDFFVCPIDELRELSQCVIKMITGAAEIVFGVFGTPDMITDGFKQLFEGILCLLLGALDALGDILSMIYDIFVGIVSALIEVLFGPEFADLWDFVAGFAGVIVDAFGWLLDAFGWLFGLYNTLSSNMFPEAADPYSAELQQIYERLSEEGIPDYMRNPDLVYHHTGFVENEALFNSLWSGDTYCDSLMHLLKRKNRSDYTTGDEALWSACMNALRLGHVLSNYTDDVVPGSFFYDAGAFVHAVRDYVHVLRALSAHEKTRPLAYDPADDRYFFDLSYGNRRVTAETFIEKYDVDTPRGQKFAHFLWDALNPNKSRKIDGIFGAIDNIFVDNDFNFTGGPTNASSAVASGSGPRGPDFRLFADAYERLVAWFARESAFSRREPAAPRVAKILRRQLSENVLKTWSFTRLNKNVGLLRQVRRAAQTFGVDTGITVESLEELGVCDRRRYQWCDEFFAKAYHAQGLGAESGASNDSWLEFIDWGEFDCDVVTVPVDRLINLTMVEYTDPINYTACRYQYNSNLDPLVYTNDTGLANLFGVDWAQTVIRFVANLNRHPSQGKVGLFYWIGFLPVPIPGVTSCRFEEVSHCMVGTGLWTALLVVGSIFLALPVIGMFYSRFYAFLDSTFAHYARVAVLLYLIPIIAYQWQFTCMLNTDSPFMVVPECLPEELAEVVDVVADGFEVPADMVIANASSPTDPPDYRSCSERGFVSLFSPLLYAGARWAPNFYIWFNYTVFAPLCNASEYTCLTDGEFDFATDFSLHRESHGWCFMRVYNLLFLVFDVAIIIFALACVIVPLVGFLYVFVAQALRVVADVRGLLPIQAEDETESYYETLECYDDDVNDEVYSGPEPYEEYYYDTATYPELAEARRRRYHQQRYQVPLIVEKR